MSEIAVEVEARAVEQVGNCRLLSGGAGATVTCFFREAAFARLRPAAPFVVAGCTGFPRVGRCRTLGRAGRKQEARCWKWSPSPPSLPKIESTNGMNWILLSRQPLFGRFKNRARLWQEVLPFLNHFKNIQRCGKWGVATIFEPFQKRPRLWKGEWRWQPFFDHPEKVRGCGWGMQLFFLSF